MQECMIHFVCKWPKCSQKKGYSFPIRLLMTTNKVVCSFKLQAIVPVTNFNIHNPESKLCYYSIVCAKSQTFHHLSYTQER